MDDVERIPTVVLGASGYVAGELLRLLSFHPRLRLIAAVSHSQPETPIERIFPHLEGAFPGVLTSDSTSALDRAQTAAAEQRPIAVFSALPHGETSRAGGPWFQAVVQHRWKCSWVDLSADFRRSSAPASRAMQTTADRPFEDRFVCALPDLTRDTPAAVSHPGCFTTAVVLGAAALFARGLCEPVVRVSAVTGSSGSGRQPSSATHHPERHSNLCAYQPLTHRHEAEMKMLLSRAGNFDPQILFVPHSGPFARGIHATLHVTLKRPSTPAELAADVQDHYSGSRFVSVVDEPPALKNVVGTNRCQIFVTARGREAVVISVIDNLTKGAAGGAVQWMNRMLGFEETLGLMLPGLGWQ